MTTQVKTSVIDLLLDDHAAIERSFDGFNTASHDNWEREFSTLIHLLIAHETAEEAIVYPALRELPGGSEIADARIAEQAQAERLLKDMEHVDTLSADFTDDLNALHAAVKAHAAAEEREVFPLLAQHKSADELAEMGAIYAGAKDKAPTHAHPHTPTGGPVKAVTVPITAIFDRVRDAIARHLV